MLKIHIDEQEMFDEEKNEFYYVKAQTLQLEHSLISISKWESKWHKPFIPITKKDTRTNEEILDYVRCMTLNSNVSNDVYACLTEAHLKMISEYINDPMTASTVRSSGAHNRGETITSELVYYWMTVYHIPFECEKWHFNRLMMLIKICGAKSQPPKKMSKGEIMRRNSALNAARRAQLHSKG